MNPLLELKNLCYAYHSKSGETYALSDISFQVQRGEFVAVVGPSGCGKSTLLSLIAGLLMPESGSVLLDGKASDGFRENTGYMLQKDHLFEWRTIYRNVVLGLEIQHKLNEESESRVNKMLKDYGLYRFRNAMPSELSGGMRQRAALIRTLALDPELLLLDEPFSALDFQTRLSVCDDVSAILRREKKTAVLVTHDLSEAVSMADRIIVLTKRPARIRSVIEIRFAKSHLTPLERRSEPEFQGYFNRLWRELNGQEEKTAAVSGQEEKLAAESGQEMTMGDEPGPEERIKDESSPEERIEDESGREQRTRNALDTAETIEGGLRREKAIEGEMRQEEAIESKSDRQEAIGSELSREKMAEEEVPIDTDDKNEKWEREE